MLTLLRKNPLLTVFQDSAQREHTIVTPKLEAIYTLSLQYEFSKRCSQFVHTFKSVNVSATKVVVNLITMQCVNCHYLATLQKV